jgi:hypothetical protein
VGQEAAGYGACAAMRGESVPPSYNTPRAAGAKVPFSETCP